MLKSSKGNCDICKTTVIQCQNHLETVLIVWTFSPYTDPLQLRSGKAHTVLIFCHVSYSDA